MPKVCVDPGHGGYDPGAVGNGLLEKDVNLAISLQLRPLLVYNGIEVIMTRDGDYAPGHLEHDLNGELNKRVSISDNFGSDLFVSIHINSGGGTGEEVLIAGTGGRAEVAAGKLLYYLLQYAGWSNRGVKVQNVLVLGETASPACLTENGFIDSVSDSTKLKDPAFIYGLARAHAKGICDYFGIAYEDPSASVPPPSVDKTSQAISLLNQAIAILKG
jgi:N-acetylmuramoyl-L-alanine amidase